MKDFESAIESGTIDDCSLDNILVDGADHHPMANRICTFISDAQNHYELDMFKFGGDGDDGEMIRAFLTLFFNQLNNG